MTESGGKAKEIVLGDEFGEVIVRVNGTSAQVHADGRVETPNLAIKESPASDTAAKPKTAPEIGDRMPDGTVYAGLSPDNGKAMYATPRDAPLTYTFNRAQTYAAQLTAHGHKDWRVPTKGELNVLFQNRAAIGGFDESGSYPAGWYWSSSQHYSNNAWDQRFSDGYQDLSINGVASSLRCVRG